MEATHGSVSTPPAQVFPLPTRVWAIREEGPSLTSRLSQCLALSSQQLTSVRFPQSCPLLEVPCSLGPHLPVSPLHRIKGGMLLVLL